MQGIRISLYKRIKNFERSLNEALDSLNELLNSNESKYIKALRLYCDEYEKSNYNLEEKIEGFFNIMEYDDRSINGKGYVLDYDKRDKLPYQILRKMWRNRISHGYEEGFYFYLANDFNPSDFNESNDNQRMYIINKPQYGVENIILIL
jgi:hypothetical protein